MEFYTMENRVSNEIMYEELDCRPIVLGRLELFIIYHFS